MDEPPWTPPDPAAYAYLLGIYLGDGYVATNGSSTWLEIALDARYPAVIDQVAEALEATIPGAHVGRHIRAGGSLVRLQVTSPLWPRVFPQHGRGKKHLRPIELMAWQREICARHPGALVRGLVHSDGCRCLNRFSTRLPSGRVATYEYPRYFFSNLSAEIRAIFCEHCDRLGIRWSRSNGRNISVAHRHSVARLDALVGPKR